MAYIATDAALNATPKGVVMRFFTAFGETLVLIGESNPRIRRIQALAALSDSELAARGLRREDIARHVLSDAF